MRLSVQRQQKPTTFGGAGINANCFHQLHRARFSRKKKAVINLPLNRDKGKKQEEKVETKAPEAEIPASKPEYQVEENAEEKIDSSIVKEEEPKIKRVPKGNFSTVGSISIKDFTKAESKSEEEAEKIIADPSHYGFNDFTEEEFLQCWGKLAKKIADSDDEGKTMIYAALTTHKPKLMENNQVLVKVDNLSQLEEVKHKRTELHEFLRHQLKNGSLEIKLEVVKNKKEKKAYTQDEKFKVMVEKNPDLLELKKRFGLDIF